MVETHLMGHVKDAACFVSAGGGSIIMFTSSSSCCHAHRSLNMMDEAHLMEHVKEAACFVSQDLPADLKAAKTTSQHKAEYVLPDGLSHSRGFLRPPLSKQELAERPAEQQEQVSWLNVAHLPQKRRRLCKIEQGHSLAPNEQAAACRAAS